MGKQLRNNSRKVGLGVAALGAAALAVVGIGYAYFSDTITGTGSATAGTLDISGTVGLTQNGEEVSGTTIPSLNPGDIIGIDASTVTNNGTKSAWIRGVLEFTSLSNVPNVADGESAEESIGDMSKYLWVCTGGETQDELIAASFGVGGFAASALAKAQGGNCTPVTTADVNTTLFGAKTTYAKPGDVISGSSEADGASTTWTPDTSAEVYFDAAAPNAAQNGIVTFKFMIQALQYRNNEDSPDEDQWDTVVASSFGL